MKEFIFPCKIQHSEEWRKLFKHSKYAKTSPPRSGVALRRNRNWPGIIIVIWDNTRKSKELHENFIEIIQPKLLNNGR